MKRRHCATDRDRREGSLPAAANRQQLRQHGQNGQNGAGRCCALLSTRSAPHSAWQQQQQQQQQQRSRRRLGGSSACAPSEENPSAGAVGAVIADAVADCVPETSADGFAHRQNADGATTVELQVAADMKNLSLDELNSLYDDIHGVRQTESESDGFLAVRLAMLDKQLRKVPRRERQEYERAVFINPSYATSHAFRLMFLRADRYDPALAARRIVRYFAGKHRLFGPELFARPILYDDLSDAVKSSLEFGLAMAYPFCTDRVGRTVFWSLYHRPDDFASRLADDPTVQDPSHPRHAQSLWYMIMSCIVSSEVTQKKGFTAVHWSHKATADDFFSLFTFQRHSFWVVPCLPLRLSGVHFCVEQSQFRHFFSLVAAFLPREMRLLSRVHYGSTMECLYSLRSFGIPDSRDGTDTGSASGGGHADLPICIDGTRDKATLQRWIARTRDCEEQRLTAVQTTDGVTSMSDSDYRCQCYSNGYSNGDASTAVGSNAVVQWYSPPRPGTVLWVSTKDVLLGRGVSYQRHQGNNDFIAIIKSYSDEHAGRDRNGKIALVTKIVEEIRASGRRFLQRDKESRCWVVVDDHKAHEKVAMGFRNLARQQER